MLSAFVFATQSEWGTNTLVCSLSLDKSFIVRFHYVSIMIHYHILQFNQSFKSTNTDG